MKYKKRPVIIDAFQFDGTVECLRKYVVSTDWNKFSFESIDPTLELRLIFLDEAFSFYVQNYAKKFFIDTLEGQHKLIKNDYVIKGVQGEYYPCKPDIFNETYEKVE